jgi:hypothetical protein
MKVKINENQALKYSLSAPALRLAVVVALLFSDRICAGGHENDPEDWSPDSAGPITTWTAPLCGRKTFVIQPFFFYNHTRGIFDAHGNYLSLPVGDKKYQFQEQLFMQYGLTDKLEIDGQTVYQQNFASQGDLKAHTYGFGDSYLFLRYCALEEKKYLPHITLHFQVKLPTGKYQHADPAKLGTDLMGATSGGGSYDTGYGLNLTKKIKPFILHADIIYGVPNEVKVDGASTRYANYLNYDFGMEYFLPKGFNLMLEFNGFTQGKRWEDGATISDSRISYLDMVPGIGWSNESIQTLIAYQRRLSGANTDANDSLILTFVYSF